MTYEVKGEDFIPGLTEEELKHSRLPLPDRDSLDEEEQEILDDILERSKRMFYSVPSNAGQPYRLTPYFNGLLQSPRVAGLWASFGDFYQPAEERGSFTHRERELAELVVASLLRTLLTGQKYLAAIHVADAVGVGLSPLDIKAIDEGRFDDVAAAEDRQLVEYVIATVKGQLTPELFDGLEARMGRKVAIEYTSYVVYRVGGMLGVVAMWGILGRPMDTTNAEALLQAFIDGTAEPHPHDRGSKWIKADDARTT